MTKTTVFLLGVCASLTAAIVIKAARPLGAYALAGGIIAYETACDVAESSRESLSASAEKVRHGLKKYLKS